MSELKSLHNNFFKKLNILKTKNPSLSVMMCHEYYKSLWPYDHDIKFKIIEPKKRILTTLKILLQIIDKSKTVTTYKKKKKINIDKSNPNIGNLYFELFKKFTKKYNQDTIKFFKMRFKNTSINFKSFVKGQNILDAGCGHGRYSFALASLGSKRITAVDYEKSLINLAKKKFKKKNLTFLNQDVLNLRFKSNKFDRIFCNGVLHHTGNLNKGLSEIFRVCKKMDIFGFFYMDLVEFFGTQEKR